MRIQDIVSAEAITALAKERFREERATDHLEGWFLAKEIQRECDARFKGEPDCVRIAKTECEVMRRIPLWISDSNLFAGT